MAGRTPTKKRPARKRAAKKKVAKKAAKKKPGRPSKFKDEFRDQVYRLTLLGATDEELAQFFKVNVDTINEWKHSKPGFSVALKAGKADADANVSDSLYKRACGYTCKETKVYIVDGKPVKVEVDKHYPPDSTAAIFWLKNRNSKNWRDKQDHRHEGNIGLSLLDRIAGKKPEDKEKGEE